jgi:hypothetical protein
MRNMPRASNSWRAQRFQPGFRLLRTGLPATTSFTADLPPPSELMHVTVSRGIMCSLFAFDGPEQTCSMPP